MFGELLSFLSLNLQVWGMIPAFIGGYWLFRRERAFFFVLITIFAFSILQFMTYRVDGYEVYCIPALLVLGLFLGIGLSHILHYLNKVAYRAGFLVLIASFSLIHFFYWYPLQNRSEDREALEFAIETLEQVPSNAVILSHQDETTFALWYGQASLSRDNIIIIDSRLLAYDWYIENLLRQHPTLDKRWLRYGGLTGLSNPIFEIQGEMHNYFLVPIR